MGRLPEDPRLAYWAEVIEGLRWAAFIADDELRLVWTSTEVEEFLGSPTEEELGYGRNAIEALTGETWLRVTTAESQTRLFMEIVPFFLNDLVGRGVDLTEALPPQFVPLLRQMEPKPPPPVLSTWFDYVEPQGVSDLPVYRVNLLLMPLYDEQGERIGMICLSYMSVRPGLVALLARGDEAMYERMARLVEPQARQAAILLCDLSNSGELSRRLPTSEYFRLIRRLWTDIDKAVAKNRGIIGKHAGDGASAFFLTDDLGSGSAAAAAAIRTARVIHERSAETFSEVLESPCLMRVGVHWSGTLYIGQLVPGGRLDVAALGDEVNQCAGIQECAENHETLASKELIERLSDDDAAALGLDPEKVSYRLVSELPEATERAVRAAGTLAVTSV
jgi:class 3 adenylate cyclase